ncbi:MAG: hypothetical protein J6J07_07095 [Oscillospiraceae bacterium]|nr:hypothetical protein [Oscillospiraceae bacterium]MBP1575781.1 hypothetical protein [Oscillospiraceae bacterium]MBQ5323188.1 hypothetical protein [Oscillospiraceae bacterium]
MKKIISIVLAMIMVFAIGATAFAATFTPSVEDPHGAINARILEDGEFIEGIIFGKKCLIVTHISEADDAIPELDEEMALLKDVYKKLLSGEMKIPYEKAGFNSANMTLIDLYDATFLCQEHPIMLEPEGVVIEITFKVNVPAGKEVCVMTYKNGQWIPAEEVTNNGNGTVTCVFEHLCPIAFAVETGSGSGSTGESVPEANPNTGAPVFFGTAALVCAAAVVSFKRK